MSVLAAGRIISYPAFNSDVSYPIQITSQKYRPWQKKGEGEETEHPGPGAQHSGAVLASECLALGSRPGVVQPGLLEQTTLFISFSSGSSREALSLAHQHHMATSFLRL